MFYIHKHFYNSGGYFQIGPNIFRCCVVLVKKSAACKLTYNRAHLAIFIADACRLKCIEIQAHTQGSWKQETFLYANFSFDCFLNVCTFQHAFEGLQDVSADSKLVDISYWCFSTKTDWNWCATSRSHKKAYIQTHFSNFRWILQIFLLFMSFVSVF